MWSEECKVWSVEWIIVWSVECGVESVSVKCRVWSVECKV